MSPDELAPVILAFVSFVSGFLSGFFARRFVRIKDEDNAGFVLTVVTTIWALSMIIDIMSPAYETSALVHGLMGAIVGFFYRPKTGTGV